MSDNLTMRDAGGYSKTLRTSERGGAHVRHQHVQVGDDVVDAAHPFPSIDAAANTKLASILSTLQAQVDLSTTLWTDDSGAFYVRRDTIDQDSNTVVVTFTTPTGSAATPGAGLRPAANEEALRSVEQLYDVGTTGTGYTAGDIVSRVVVINQNTTPPSVVSSAWINLTTGAAISAPTAGHITQQTRAVQITASALPSGAATQTTLAAVLAALAPLGTQTTLAAVLAALGPLATQTTAAALLTELQKTAGAAIEHKAALQATARLTPGVINFSSSGDQALVSATSGQTTRLHRLLLKCAAATNLTFKSGSTALTGAIPMAAGEGLVIDFCAEPWFITGANEALNLNSSAAVQVSGCFNYVKSA